MYVAVVPNRGSPPAILLRESYREAGKTKNRTLANLSRWPAERIEQLRAVLRGDQLLPAAEAVEIVRALPHGHVLAALGTARRIALEGVPLRHTFGAHKADKHMNIATLQALMGHKRNETTLKYILLARTNLR